MLSLRKLFFTLLFSNLIFHSAAQTSGCIYGNCKDGLGTYKFDDGSQYTGEFVNGARTGLGTYDWKDGAFYYGNFVDGKLEGDGFYIGTDSTKDLIGIFHDGKFSEKKSYKSSGCLIGNCENGTGIYLWESNDMFIGKWMNGNRTGYGRYDWNDGGYYYGYFKDNLLDGNGYYKGEDGKVQEGYFEKGTLIKSK